MPGDGPEDVTKALILAYRRSAATRGSWANLCTTQRSSRRNARCARSSRGPRRRATIDARILKLRKTRVPQNNATVYTLAQLEAILAACASPTEGLAIRLLIGSGLRLSEAVGVGLRGPDGLPDLEIDNLGRGRATLRVRWDAGAKGFKTRRHRLPCR